MTHVVLEACIQCRYTDCVDVALWTALKKIPNFLVIGQMSALIVPCASLSALLKRSYERKDVPADQQHMIALNAELTKIGMANHFPHGRCDA